MRTPVIEQTLSTKETFVYKDNSGPYFNPTWHFHPEFQISYIIEGRGTRFVGDHVQPFQEGDLTLMGPNVPHLWRSDDPYFEKDSQLSTRGLVVYFDHHLFNQFLLDKEEFYKINKLVENAARGIEFFGDTRNKVKDMLPVLAYETGFKRVIRLLEIIDLLANSQDFQLLSSPGYAVVFKGDDVERMRKVYDYVMTNFKSKISLEEIAGMLNMTTSAFCRYFKPRANKTFSYFVNEVRIGHARKLLLRDDYTVAQVAYKCGFSTLSHFNRQFKLITKRTPHAYRRLFQNLNSGFV